MSKLLKLKPFISTKIWGGERLKSLKNLKAAPEKIGETWEVSTLEEGPSLVGETPLNKFCDLSYLVKFIDTNDHLSVQVHPGDEYARKYENSSGKTECWLILDSQEDCGIYLGFKKGVTKKEFFNAVKANLPVNHFLNFIPVKRGDFFKVPAGTVHAIGKGVTLCEVQQSSGITYRVWDWGRVDANGVGRELHVEKASDVLDFSEKFNDRLMLEMKRGLLDQVGISTLIEHESFNVQLFSQVLQKDMVLNLSEKDSLIVLDGELSFSNFKLNAFEAAIMPEAEEVEFKASSQACFILVSEGKNEL